MNIEETRILYTADYGSRFQGGSDAHSDQDFIHIVQDDLVSALFRGNDKGVYKSSEGNDTDDATYYSLTKFVKMLETNGGKDIMIMLSALMKQNNISFLKPLYDADMFNAFVHSHSKATFYSIVGVANKIINKMEKSNELTGTFNGKEYVKLYTAMLQLEHAFDVATVEGTTYTHENYLQVNTPDEIVAHKRNKELPFATVEGYIQSCKVQLDTYASKFRASFVDSDSNLDTRDAFIQNLKVEITKEYVQDFMRLNG